MYFLILIIMIGLLLGIEEKVSSVMLLVSQRNISVAIDMLLKIGFLDHGGDFLLTVHQSSKGLIVLKYPLSVSATAGSPERRLISAVVLNCSQVPFMFRI